jgi:cytochrome c peroxidase
MTDRPKEPKDPLGLVGTTIDGRYDVLSLVDEGGYGWVYKARRVMWDKPVALKLFKRRDDNSDKQAAAKRAFIAEGAVLNELSRKTTAIVQSFDIGEVQQPDGFSLLYMALEWLEGTTLSKLCAAERARAPGNKAPWPIERIIVTVEPVAVALAIAHASGVAHRDIKPGNIFLVGDVAGGDTTAKLLDFGVAKVVEDLTEGFDKTGHREGPYTPKYAAPEQFSKRYGSTGPWTDVYSLAMVCVELLVGRYPLEAESFGQLTFTVCDKDARPTPRRFGAAASEAVEAVFARALAVDSDTRFRDAGSFWRALLDAAGVDSANFPVIEGRIKTYRPVDQPSLPAYKPDRGSSTNGPASVTVAPDSSRRAASWLVGGVAAVAVIGAAGVWWMAKSWGGETHAAPTASAPEPPPSVPESYKKNFGPLPVEIVSADNPITEEKVKLGRMLYHDTRLSRGQELACQSCHPLDRYGADGRRVSEGHRGQLGRRNALTIYHAAGAFALMWDGRSPTIEAQATLPLMEASEMSTTKEDVVRMLQSIPGYTPAFVAAFPDSRPAITIDNVGRALGAFERRLLTPSRWDRFLKGDEKALDDREKRGFIRFVEVGCATCHDGTYVGLGMYQRLGLENEWPSGVDRGRFEVTKQDVDVMRFRVASLRNVERTGPYFHDGSVAALGEAVRMMAHHQLDVALTDAELDNIVAWLKALTGELPEKLVEKPELPPNGPTTPKPVR